MLMSCGLAFGYSAGAAVGCDDVSCRTISMETGVQQVGLAGAILVLSLDEPEDDAEEAVFAKILGFPLFYGVIGIVISGAYALALNRMPPADDGPSLVWDADAGVYKEAGQPPSAASADADAAPASDDQRRGGGGDDGRTDVNTSAVDVEIVAKDPDGTTTIGI